MKPIFTALLILALATPAMRGEKAWHLVADNGSLIPVATIDYIIQNPEAECFDIILIGDDAACLGVKRSTFEFIEDTGIRLTESGTETIMGPYGDRVTVKGLKPGADVSIYSSSGTMVYHHTAAGSDNILSIDISNLASGIYVIRTPRSTVKFLKR